MKYVIIRDDDVSFFTRKDMLQLLYGEIIEDNIVNFSVIPNVYSSIKYDEINVYHNKVSVGYDPLISPDYAGDNNYYNIGDNHELIDFLNGNNNIEILQHGYTHEKINNIPEFSIQDGDFVFDISVKGINILNKYFKKNISFFIPPWNEISGASVIRLRDNYKGIITASIVPFHKSLGILISFYLNKIFNKSYYLHNNLLMIDSYELIKEDMDITSLSNYFNKLLKNRDIIVIQNHYWGFFNNWKEPNILVKQWKIFYDSLLKNNEIRIISYNELFSILKNE